MGTMIQRYKLDEADYRGERFKDYATRLKGNNDLLSLTQPDVIREIHEQYLAAGADIVETNTFGATARRAGRLRPGSACAREMNVAAAQAGARGLRQVLSSAGQAALRRRRARADAEDREHLSPTSTIRARATSPSTSCAHAYREQAKALLEGGCDLFLVETIFDTLNAKAAIFALDELMRGHRRAAAGDRSPARSPMRRAASCRARRSRRSGTRVRHARPLAIGLNCALGAALMRPYIEELSQLGDTFVSCYPNAGLPNPMSDTGFDETPEVTSGLLKEFAQAGFVNIAGGCCGTTPEHIAEIAKALADVKPRKWPSHYRDAA